MGNFKPFVIDNTCQDLLQFIDSKQQIREEQLLSLVEINSSSLNPVGVNRTGEFFSTLFTPLADSAERIEVHPWERMNFSGEISSQPLGDLWHFSKRPNAPVQVLMCGHTDTVFPLDCNFQQATRIDRNRLNAPGAADMKGGILVMLSALEALEQHPMRENIGWTVLLNPDEEIGSPGSAPILEKEALKHHLGLIYEPALPDGSLAGERKGSGNFTIKVEGRAAHAGREPEKGRNAINKAALIVLELDKLNHTRPGLTLNTGMIQAGETTNKVPDLAVFKFNIRITDAGDAAWCVQTLEDICTTHSRDDGYQVSMHGQFGRMPKRFDSKHQSLFNLLQRCSSQLGVPIHWQATGGCCDGNNLSAAGLPNIDTLGVKGDFIHSDQEYIELPSLSQRAQLSALLLMHIATEGLPFLKQSETGE